MHSFFRNPTDEIAYQLVTHVRACFPTETRRPYTAATPEADTHPVVHWRQLAYAAQCQGLVPADLHTEDGRAAFSAIANAFLFSTTTIAYLRLTPEWRQLIQSAIRLWHAGIA